MRCGEDHWPKLWFTKTVDPDEVPFFLLQEQKGPCVPHFGTTDLNYPIPEAKAVVLKEMYLIGTHKLFCPFHRKTPKNVSQVDGKFSVSVVMA